jgi:hypothetical protein
VAFITAFVKLINAVIKKKPISGGEKPISILSKPDDRMGLMRGF